MSRRFASINLTFHWVFLSLLLFSPIAVQSAIPDTVSIQGTLEASGGGPVTETHDYRIRFYPQETGGGFVAAVTGTVKLSSAGRFSIEFVAPQVLFSVNEVWYDLAIDTGDDGIFPDDLYPTRVRMGSVPFEVKAGDSESLGGKPALDFVTNQDLPSSAWLLGGNAGTSGQSLGTTDLQSLNFQVNGQTALTLVPGTSVPSVLGGYGGNLLGATVEGGVISGGGHAARSFGRWSGGWRSTKNRSMSFTG